MNLQEPNRSTQEPTERVIQTLESWKEIAAYLQRDAKTASRWEKEEGLPVHRHSHKSRSSVYAYPKEIDAWRAARKVTAEPPPVPFLRSLFAPPRSLAFGVTMVACLIMIGNGIRPVSAQPRQSSRQVWTGPKVDTYGNVSQDGRYISHNAWRDALALYDLVSGADRILVPSKDYNDTPEESAISKDGRLVAYSFFNHKTNRYELRLANVDGDPNPRLLYDNQDIDWIGPYDWSPDGKSIAVEVQRGGYTDAQIGLISVRDRSLRVLKSVDWRGTGRIFFSPDGKYIGYDLPKPDTNRQHDVFVMSVDGASELPVVTRPSLNFMMGWSPDGKWLLFASNVTGPMSLWALPFGNGKPTGTPELIKRDIGWAEPMGVTASGSLYYGITPLRDEGLSIQVASLDFRTGKLLAAPTDIAPERPESDSQPAWSPDGKYLAYISTRGRVGSANAQNKGHSLRDRALVIRSAETGRVVRELECKLNSGPPALAWASDGLSLLMPGVDLKGRRGVYRIDTQTGETSSVVLFPTKGRPLAWSPDGKNLYFRRSVSDGKEIVFVQRDIATGIEKELIRRPFLSTGINLSPDGQYIATAGINPSNNSRIMLLIPTAGGEPRELIRVAAGVNGSDLTNFNNGQALMGATWASDSQGFMTRKLVRGEKPTDELWWVPLDGSAPRKLDLPPSNVAWGSGFSVHPDGHRVAYTINETARPQTSEVWVLENFLPKASAAR